MKNPDLTMVGKLVDALFSDIASSGLVTPVCLVGSRYLFSKGLKYEGMAFLTITLPQCSKFLEKSLELGTILHGETPPYMGKRCYYDRRPALLHSLWAQLFNEQGQLSVGASDVEAVFLLRQAFNLFKKLDGDCDTEYVDAEISAYLRIENELPHSHPETWDSVNPMWSRRTGHPLWGASPTPCLEQGELFTVEPRVSYPWSRFDQMCRRMSADLGELDAWNIRPKHGPGAVSERGHVIKHDFRVWPQKLEAHFPRDWHGRHDLSNYGDYDETEPASRMVAVPKTQKGPRLIAAEPSAHQWIQGGIQRWFEDRVRGTFLGDSIDFRRQEYSKALALEASFHNRAATVDLSAASDRVSTRLVEYVFQGNITLLNALHACRTRSILIPKSLGSGSLNDRTLLLRKFAPMGSACTFPVQTIIFTMIAHFAVAICTDDWDMSKDAFKRRAAGIRVFGDDIIVPNDSYQTLVDLLHECGLLVNQGKSFSRGMFREACGMDAYRGSDVTPGYIRKLYEPTNPEALASVVECSNNLHKVGMWHLAAELLKTVGTMTLNKLIVAGNAIGSVSVLTFMKGLAPWIKTRVSPTLHRLEAFGVGITAKVSRIEGTGEASLNQFFTDTPAIPLNEDGMPSRSDRLSYLSPKAWEHGQASNARVLVKRAWVHTYHVAREDNPERLLTLRV
ncbi:RNA-directed RNA polymerase [ssRNA phage Gerhypos.2_11]|uniref:RNA-directed RNA polymerase n=2 Tax=Leviviricetes TaxID=2842243 RepID=A0A8S5KYX7_9VIRU|nr:RNA-directed RNA polymerase [ssRNA phage Gerhypos.2_11]QDH88939.1 MAG: RNA-dependent RNA polymerase [Leviviridae sp.]DAD50253.1 TPA_asm: RNA-directed RNA polymerase [ssRNA phage Gerhypos.2_11]